MEEMTPNANASHPFNSTLETGIRAVILLEAFHPRLCDLTEMTWLDHLVVHTADLEIGGNAPPSLHPDLPNRTGELLVRRHLLERSLHLMQQMHMVDVLENEAGVFFAAADDAPSYVDSLRSEYSLELKRRAAWLASRFSALSSSDIKAQIEARVGRWTAQFRADQNPTRRVGP